MIFSVNANIIYYTLKECIWVFDLFPPLSFVLLSCENVEKWMAPNPLK